MLLKLFVHLCLHARVIVSDVLGGLEAREHTLINIARAKVGGHDDHRVLEVNLAALRIGQAAFFQNLQQRVEDIRVSLLDLIEEDDREGTTTDLFGELATLVVADVAGRSTEETRGGVLLRELGHIELDQRILITEEEFGQGLRELCLTDTGRSGEDEGATGTLRVLQAASSTTNRLGQSLNRCILPDDALVQLVFHLEQLRGLGLGELEDRDTGRHSQNFGDIVLSHLSDRVARPIAPAGFLLLALFGQLLLFIAKRGGLLEVLIVDRGLLIALHFGDLLVELTQLRRRGHAGNTQASTGLVHQVNGLIGKETIRDVAVGQLGGGLDRSVGDDDAVVGLVAITQALEDSHGLFDAGLIDLHRLETALKSRILFDVLAVFVVGGCTDRLQFAACKHGLEHLRGVDGAFRSAGTNQGVDLVDEEDDVPASADFLEDLLQALFEVATVARAGDQRAHIEAVDLLVLDGFGHVAGNDCLGETFDNGGLTDARFTDQNGVVLRAAREDLHDALHFSAAANHRVELIFAGSLGEVAAELLENRRVCLAAST